MRENSPSKESNQNVDAKCREIVDHQENRLLVIHVNFSEATGHEKINNGGNIKMSFSISDIQDSISISS